MFSPQILYTAAMLTTLALIALASFTADPTLKISAAFGDNMVLKHSATCPIWGTDAPGTAITIRPDFGPEVTTKADATGKWTASLTTPAADTAPFKGHSLEIRGTSTLTLRNVLLGEVWICSGQSNMEMMVGDFGGGYQGTKDSAKELESANMPPIRLMDLSNVVSSSPASEAPCEKLGGEPGSWHICTPATARPFSAVGYFFGRGLHDKLNIPIGLIGANWGGTPAQSWTSAEGLRPFPQYAEALAAIATKESVAALRAKSEAAVATWKTNLEKHIVDEFAKTTFSADSKTISLPAIFGAELSKFDGVIWCQREFEIPATSPMHPLVLSTGAIDDMDVVFIDGVPVARTLEMGNWDHPRSYTLAALKPGKHTITLAVIDTGGQACATGTPDQWSLSATGETPISLAGNWTVRTGSTVAKLPRYPQTAEVTAWTPTALFNGMIAPLIPMRVSGAVWYQGESNRGDPAHYGKLFPAMIQDWRKHFNQGWEANAQPLGFYFAEIAPFNYGDGKPLTLDLRNAQRQALALPFTGMASTMDVGNLADIHPNDKKSVGDRLARLALKTTYGMSSIETSGPVIESATIRGETLRLTFTHATGLNGDPNGFEVAGADKVFTKANVAVDGTTLILTGYTTTPHYVRYANQELSEVRMWNGEKLPMVPFEVEITASK